MNNNNKKTRIIRRFVIIAIAILLSTIAVGCNLTKTQKATIKSEAASATEKTETKEKRTTEPANSDVSNTSKDTEAKQEKDEKIEIIDAADRKVILDKPANKIVSGYYITTSMLIALQLEEQVIGVEAKAASRPIYKLAAPDFLELSSVGSAKDFDIEGCAALKPDLVILPKKLTEQADILNGLGITSMVVNPESAAELEETIMNVAKATGRERQADKLISYYEERTKMLEETAAAGRATRRDKGLSTEPPKIYMSGTTGVLRTAGPGMYQNSQIELAGGTNAAFDLEDKGWTNISYEKFLTYNPDIIVIIPEAQYTKEDVLSEPRLKDIKAIKNKTIYEMPSAFEAWDSPVVSGILGTMWLSSIVNEEKYSFDEFKIDAAAFYKEFYRIQIDQSLITK